MKIDKQYIRGNIWNIKIIKKKDFDEKLECGDD